MVLIRHHHLLLFHLYGGHLLLLLQLFSFDRGLNILSLNTICVLFLWLPVWRLHRLTVEFRCSLRGALLFNDWHYLSSSVRCFFELFQDFLFHRCEVWFKWLSHASSYVHFTAISFVENRLIFTWPLQVARSCLTLQMPTRLRMTGLAVLSEVHEVVVVQLLDIFKFERQRNFLVVPSLASPWNTAIASSFIFN